MACPGTLCDSIGFYAVHSARPHHVERFDLQSGLRSTGPLVYSARRTIAGAGRNLDKERG